MEQQENEFQMLKNHLISTPVLQQPDFNQPLYIYIPMQPVEVLTISTYEAQEIIPETTEILQLVKDTMNYCPVTDVHLYRKISFDSTGVYYEGMTRPNIRCWYRDILYSPSDKCWSCYLDLRLWIMVRSRLIEEVAKCYWPNMEEEKPILI
ncbi:23994_t:CDS:2, partial [Gigaspora rosea]